MICFLDGWFDNWFDNSNNKPFKIKESNYGDAVFYIIIIILTCGWLREWLLRRKKHQSNQIQRDLIEPESRAPNVPYRYHVAGYNCQREVQGVNVMRAIMPARPRDNRARIRMVDMRETDDFNAVIFDQNRRIHNANYEK